MAPESPAAAASETTPASRADHFSAIVESSDDAILSKDPEGIITSWNPGAERIYGYAAAEAIGQPISILIPPHRAGEEKRILAQIMDGNRVDHYETERVAKDGRLLTVSLSVSPLRSEDGTIVGASVIARDITTLARTRELTARLHAVTTALSSELTPERVVEVMLEQATEGLGASAGAIGLVEGGEIVLVGTRGYADSGLAEWQRFPLDADVPMSIAIREGTGVYASSPAELVERFPIFADATVRHPSLAVLPMIAGGETFGAISLSFPQQRDFDPEDRIFLLTATQQAAHALDRARRYDEERVAARRQRLLAEAGELMSASLDPDTTLRRFAELSIEHIADWCGIELQDEHGELRSVAVAHVDPKRVELARELRERYPTDPDAETGVPAVVRSGESELYEEVPEEVLVQAAQDEEHLSLLRDLGLESAMVVPLRARGRVFGAITFVSSSSERRYDERDLEFAEDLARRAALAVDNAQLYRREHEAALTLQRSLLPQSLPEVPGMQFDAHYHPAAPESEVGGDWYEVVALGDGTVGVTIGDIAGRGIRAAAVMGRVRPAFRAYVLDGHAPREATERIDHLMRELGGREMTTLFHLHYDPHSRTARYVRAGHPPALARLPDGEVIELWGVGKIPPLGVISNVSCPQAEVELPAGSLLLLYTDGLIERRETSLDEGLARLKEALAGAPQGAGEALDWVESRLEIEAIPDDVATLAMAIDA